MRFTVYFNNVVLFVCSVFIPCLKHFVSSDFWLFRQMPNVLITIQQAGEQDRHNYLMMLSLHPNDQDPASWRHPSSDNIDTPPFKHESDVWWCSELRVYRTEDALTKCLVDIVSTFYKMLEKRKVPLQSIERCICQTWPTCLPLPPLYYWRKLVLH